MPSRNDILSTCAVALASSALTVALLYLTMDSHRTNDEDDFVAHQGKPTNDNETHVPYIHQRLSISQIRRRSRKLLQDCQKRRTLRFFSTDPVPADIIESILQTAATAPSGAHKQPVSGRLIRDVWSF